ncbi:MAG: ATP-binding protein [Pseudomonadota bacterium]
MQGLRSGSLVVALGLGSLLLSQAVCFAVVWWVPRPAPPTMNFGEALMALRGEAPAEDFGLLAWRQVQPPEAPGDPAMSAAVAARLGIPSGDVHVAWWRPEASPTLQPEPVGSMIVGDSARAMDALVMPGLRVPAFVLSVREPDKQWRVVTVAHNDTWRNHVLLALAAGALLLAPLVAWAALRLGRPLRRLADAGSVLDLRAGAALPEQGPREVRMLAQAMNRARTRLLMQSEDTTRMLAAVAHDLRTPLTGLRLRAESAPAEQAQRMVEDIERMDHMIGQVLSYARGELAPARHEPVDLGDLLDGCVQHARLRGVGISARLADLPPFTGDASLLRRALDNLIENAARYAGDVELSAGTEDRDLVIDVADRGPGIPDADKQRLLTPFERRESSRNRSTGGTGLGLAVAVTAAHQHGGQLALLDREGGGLVARLRLPL